jgi:hypothetical protein
MRRLCFVALLLCAGMTFANVFEFVTAGRVAPITVAAGKPEYVRLAAEDLAADVLKITGKKET